ncbi:MAG: zf-HC2 domain-containing protein, partial [Desulfovibrionales bacterium]|nr:zf-HC2 domain-containing protein [Desulfovibrionales bacterium]
MWSCVRKQKRLGAYLDGELNEFESKGVGAHVADCSACCKKLEELRRLTRVMHGLEVPPAPADLADQVMARARTRSARAHV